MHSSHHSHGRGHGHGRHEDHPGHHFGPRGGRHGFGHGDWRGPEEGRGGRRRRVFDSNELRLVLLKLIADQPRHGYELIRAIEDLTGGFYVPSPGVVYPTLTLLQDMGQIEEAASDGARKAFAVTADGSAQLAAKKDEIEALFARLAELATQRERSDGGPIRRAMQNLKMVLISRLESGEVKTETLHQVASILDDAAQKIERL
ncbi:MAG: PadR family transcriptional regulator [Alphaproteobacteria bacterium]